MMRAAAALGIALQIGAGGDPGLGSDLRAGMQLTYASDGRDQPAWTVDAVDRVPGLKEDADCARVRIRRQAGQTEAPEERLCVERKTRNLCSAGSASSALIVGRAAGTRRLADLLSG